MLFAFMVVVTLLLIKSDRECSPNEAKSALTNKRKSHHRRESDQQT